MGNAVQNMARRGETYLPLVQHSEQVSFGFGSVFVIGPATQSKLDNNNGLLFITMRGS